MIDAVLILVFSLIMLIFMVYPAIKITQFIFKNFDISQKYFKPVMFTIVLILSLFIGLFLKYA